MSPSDLQGADQEGNANYGLYQDALKVAPAWTNASKREGGSGLWENHTDKFANGVPSIGAGFKGEGGKLYIATSGISEDKNDDNGTEYFYALDPATGNTMKISAANGGGYTTWQKALQSVGVTTGSGKLNALLGGEDNGVGALV